MKNFKNLVSNTKFRVGAVATALACAVPSISAFAADEVGATMSTALSAVKTDMMSGIAVVAPIGIAIFGATFVWKKGIKFFSSVANK